MTETNKNSGDKLSVTSTKTLTLKRGGVEQGVVRQSFSHGRSKAVVVEKVKRRIGGPGEARAEPPAAPDRSAAAPKRVAPPPATAKAPAAAPGRPPPVRRRQNPASCCARSPRRSAAPVPRHWPAPSCANTKSAHAPSKKP